MKNKNLVYHLIHAKNFLNADGLALKEKVFSLWASEWKKLYAEQGSDHVPHAEDFHRYDVLACLTLGPDLVGMSAHTFVDLRDETALALEFLRTFDGEFRRTLLADDKAFAVTIESLLAHPGYQGKVLGVSVGRLLLRLAGLMIGETSVNASIAVARNDNKVSAMCEDLGFHIVHKDFPCRNFSCDLIALDQGHQKPFPDAERESLAQNIWRARRDHVGLAAYSPTASVRKAA